MSPASQNLQLVEKVNEIAARKGCTPGQLALAWVHAQGDDVFPIPGMEQNPWYGAKPRCSPQMKPSCAALCSGLARMRLGPAYAVSDCVLLSYPPMQLMLLNVRAVCAGTKREKYLAENIAAFEISQRLTKEDLAEIDAAFPHAEIAGERYPEANMKATYKHSERK